ncbi:MAG: transposase [Candidatus Omnitrophota bacterium]|nr:transposase [Candidatus Omnitrophota bacterium]
MARIARVVAVGFPYHITQRGNYKQNVFLSDEDRYKYLKWLKEYSRHYKTEILAYCLMNNHVHFIAIPHQETSLARTFNIAHMRYSQYFNKKIEAAGHLWQGRFYSCILDEKHLYSAIRYVERNPVRSGLVEKPWDWKWSSAAIHMGKGSDNFGLGKVERFIDVGDWKEYLSELDDKDAITLIRRHTKTGRPLGNSDFIEKLEKMSGRILKLKKAGRQKGK